MRTSALCLVLLLLITSGALQAQDDRSGVRPFVGGGLHRSHLSYPEESGMMAALEYERYTGYIVNAGIDYRLKQQLRKLFLRLAVSYRPTVHKGEGEQPSFYNPGATETVRYELRTQTIAAHVYTNYDILQVAEGVTVSAGIGGGINKTYQDRNRVTTFSSTPGGMSYGQYDISNYDPTWWDLSARVGVRYRHFEANVSSTLLDQYSTSYKMEADERTVRFTLHYRF